jgi:DMSO/TMAO reductase YedYZ molybdopterin-dependent catalytic subunit
MYEQKKHIIKSWVWIFILIVPVLLGACGSPNVEWELTVTGDVSDPATFTYDELVEMPQVNLDEILMEKSMGPDEVRSFSGVDLLVLLEKVGAPENFSTITAKAADGYAIEISRDEMVDGIVALKQGGEWIVDVDPDAGPIRLVFPSTPANRWVFQVNEIVVNQ